jgi:hypothetical protein
MNNEDDLDIEKAEEPGREIDWSVSEEGETSLEHLLYVLDIELA